jgi:hypothetical protein
MQGETVGMIILTCFAAAFAIPLLPGMWKVVRIAFDLIREGMSEFWAAIDRWARKMNQPLPPKRTPVQKKFNTDVTWPQIKWDIARKEHEMFLKQDWTHHVDDCVHPECNPDLRKRIRNGVLETAPTPPRSSRGGAVSAARPVYIYNEKKPVDQRPSYTCLDCGRTSYNPNDIANQYCGNCHEYKTPF